MDGMGWVGGCVDVNYSTSYKMETSCGGVLKGNGEGGN
jgi:hypothetical protein